MQRLELELDGISVDGTVIDLETVGLEPTSGGITTFGSVSGHTLRIIQAENQTECVELEAQIKDAISSLPRPYYAYNKSFEEKWLRRVSEYQFKIDRDLMAPWKALAESRGEKWPKLRDLVRPPVFYYGRWGVADLDRTTDPEKLFGGIREGGRLNVVAVREILARESNVEGPHTLWQRHLRLLGDPEIRAEIARLSAAMDAIPNSQRADVCRLPNDNWSTCCLAAIMCHNMMDLLGETSLLLWVRMFRWLK